MNSGGEEENEAATTFNDNLIRSSLGAEKPNEAMLARPYVSNLAPATNTGWI